MYKTMEQIKKEYDGHWVFLINCVEGEYHSFKGGEVAIVSKNWKETSRGWTDYTEAEHGPTFIFYAGSPEYDRVGFMHKVGEV